MFEIESDFEVNFLVAVSTFVECKKRAIQDYPRWLNGYESEEKRKLHNEVSFVLTNVVGIEFQSLIFKQMVELS